MAQLTLILLSALVALFHIHPRLSNAVPLTVDREWFPRELISNAPGLVAAAPDSAVIPDVVEFAPELSGAASSLPGTESTVTQWETTTVTVQPTATAVPSNDVGPKPQTWVLPEAFTDLSPFRIDKIAYGSPNIVVVMGIPAKASATIASPGSPTPVVTPAFTESSLTSSELPRRWTNSSSAYRLFFPSGSINPGNKPQGGSDFYATPLPVQSATNVTLQYSVFFPADFEWARGGKLPGLYGGHGGCSGGNNAKSCFSTRMMWRQGGAGELYLYAPKDKQTLELCQVPPQSVCDAAYGLSIGRGSFHFAAGDWTHVSQTVRLNTPGKQDGGFELVVNGQRILRRDDVFYRNLPSNSDRSDGSDSGDNGSDDDGWGGDGGDSDENDGGDDGGLLGDLLRRESSEMSSSFSGPLSPHSPVTSNPDDDGDSQAPLFAPLAVPMFAGEALPMGNLGIDVIPASTDIQTTTVMSTMTTTRSAQGETSTLLASSSQVQMESQGDAPSAIGFSGIFFSTFFGGHEVSWASPKDQYSYFKDFGMTVNA